MDKTREIETQANFEEWAITDEWGNELQGFNDYEEALNAYLDWSGSEEIWLGYYTRDVDIYGLDVINLHEFSIEY